MEYYRYVLYQMQHGADRRDKLIEVIQEIGRLAVNRRGMINLRYDPDFKKLLKKGTLSRDRDMLPGGVGRTVVFVT